MKVKLKEAVEAHDQTVQAAKEHELETKKLVGGLVTEKERVNPAILGTGPFPHFSSPLACCVFSEFAGLLRMLLS